MSSAVVDTCRDRFGPLTGDLRQQVEAVLAAASQAPRSKPADGAWSVIPDQLTLYRALRYAFTDHQHSPTRVAHSPQRAKVYPATTGSVTFPERGARVSPNLNRKENTMTDNGTTKPSITIDDLEALAAQIESEASAERERLHRLIRALARILVIREPERFKPQALEYSDEDGSYDNYDGNYPPDIVYKDHRGPQLMMVRGNNTTEIATSGGFYHDWRLETTDPGLYVSLSGDLYGCTQTGTGKFAPFAARPGNCNVMCRLSWDTLDLDDISMERLREAETTLRNLVAPFLAAVS